MAIGTPVRSLLLSALVLASACSSATARPEEAVAPARSRPRAPADAEAVRLLARGGTLVAAARAPELPIHVEPGTERPYMFLDARNPWGQPLQLLVLRSATASDGALWIRVQLPIWPNGQTGWVAASQVRLSPTAERVVVDLSQRTLVRFRGAEASLRIAVAIGKAGTPTPPGRYVVWARVATGEPAGPYGSFILGLSGFSESIHPSEWPGEPRLAIHGTDDPSDAGRAVSNGCVRVLNALLRSLRSIPMGTPVLIRR